LKYLDWSSERVAQGIDQSEGWYRFEDDKTGEQPARWQQLPLCGKGKPG
jgi:hypothetical protein